MVRQNNERMNCECPQGHKLRGPISLIGKQIRCPKCKDVFIFGETYKNSVSDTTVMRILGSGPLPPAEVPQVEQTKSCDRCGMEISPTASVCEHCDCYVGALPDFFRQLGGDRHG